MHFLLWLSSVIQNNVVCINSTFLYIATYHVIYQLCQLIKIYLPILQMFPFHFFKLIAIKFFITSYYSSKICSICNDVFVSLLMLIIYLIGLARTLSTLLEKQLWCSWFSLSFYILFISSFIFVMFYFCLNLTKSSFSPTLSFTI